MYNLKNQQLVYKNTIIKLSNKEHTLLKLLLESRKKVLTLEHMEYKIWPSKSVKDSTRRTFIYRLNHKLKHRLVKTIPGVGYQLSCFYKEYL